MNSVRLTPAAQADLTDIWDFTCERWGSKQAETYLRELWAAAKRLAANPLLGRPIDDIRAGYFQHGTGSHLIFFTRRSDGVDVIRVLHQRMDLSRHL